MSATTSPPTAAAAVPDGADQPAAGGPLVVGDDLVDQFRLASRDENPLHVDPAYARTSSFGEPVVYGVLAGLVALAGVPRRPGQVATRVMLRFPGAVLRGRPQHRLVVADRPDRAEVHLAHGATRTVEAVVEFGPGTVARGVPDRGPESVRAAARVADLGDLAEGDRVAAGWQPRWAELARLVDRLGLAERGLGPVAVAALAWASYLAGMETPGRASLLADVTAEFGPPRPVEAPPEAAVRAGPLTCGAVIERITPRFRMLTVAGSVEAPELAAMVKVRVFHRPAADRSDVATLVSLLAGRRDALAGRSALVVGASRGLGAAIAQALALAGADVYAGFHRSAADATAMRADLGAAGGRVHLLPGDAADPAWCRAARRRAEDDGRPLDLLVLNACPPPVKVPLVDGSAEVAASYLSRALDLVRTPLSVLAQPVAQADGTVVAVSTRWASEPEPGWFPYVAAKAAAEGMLRAAAAEYPRARWAVIRPGRLRTAFNATPMAAGLGEPVEPVAAGLVGRLADQLPAGVLHVLG